MIVRFVAPVAVPGSSLWEHTFDEAAGWTILEHADLRVSLAHDDFDGKPTDFDVRGVAYTTSGPRQKGKRGKAG